jgi:CBS domain containing-hemolysin-like protein
MGSIDLVALLAQDGDAPSLEELARPAPTTSEDALLDDLLERLREGGGRFAFVEGKEGRRTGIVTLETVLETIVGDLEDELDRELDERR